MRVWSSSHLLTIWNIQNCCFWATNCSTTELLCAQFEGDYLWDVQVMPRAALLTKTDPKWTVCPGSSRIKTELFWSILYKFDLSCVHRNIQCTSVHMHGMYVYILLYTSHISLSIRSPWWWGVLSCTSNVAVLEAVACLHVCFWWHWTVSFFAKPIAETNAVFTCFTFLMKFKYVYIIYIIYTYTCFLILSSWLEHFWLRLTIRMAWESHCLTYVPILCEWDHVPESHFHCKKEIHAVHALERWWEAL